MLHLKKNPTCKEIENYIDLRYNNNILPENLYKEKEDYNQIYNYLRFYKLDKEYIKKLFLILRKLFYNKVNNDNNYTDKYNYERIINLRTFLFRLLKIIKIRIGHIDWNVFASNIYYYKEEKSHIFKFNKIYDFIKIKMINDEINKLHYNIL